MPVIIAIAPTILRGDDGRVVNVKKDKAIDVSIFPDRAQMLRFRFAGNDSALGIKQNEEFLGYSPHWSLPELWQQKPVTPAAIKLPVPYFAQIDSRSDGYRYCFSHACAMMAACLMGDRYYNLAAGYAQPENYYISIVRDIGDTTDASVQIKALQELGIDAYFTQTISPKDLYEALAKKVPLPIGVAYKASGHWVTLVGQQEKNWLVHDPYGVRNGSTNQYVLFASDQGKEGAFDRYSPTVMDAVYFDQRIDSDRECGWAIVPVSVNGKPTGLREGM